MSEGGETPPGDSDGFSDDEAARGALVEAMQADIGMNLAALVSLFGPISLTEVPGDLIDFMVREQLMMVEEVLPSLSPERAKERPRIVVEITKKGAPSPLRFTVTKRIELCKSLDEAMAWGLFVAFIRDPAARGLLRLHGYSYEFKEVKASSILVPN